MALFSISTQRMIILLSLAGMLLFVIFYIIAAVNYPGGSYASFEQIGFSIKHNYLCDLLDANGVNGDHNNGNVYARIALGFLCLSVIIVWYYLPKLFAAKSKNQIVMSSAGVLAMITTFFLASGGHDIVVRIAGIFGLITLVTCLIELYRYKHYLLFALGIVCLIQFLANYYIYESGQLILALPAIQKFTFISFILWFVILDLAIYKKMKTLES